MTVRLVRLAAGTAMVVVASWSGILHDRLMVGALRVLGPEDRVEVAQQMLAEHHASVRKVDSRLPSL